MATYSDEPLSAQEEADRQRLMNTVGGASNLYSSLPPSTIRREMAFRRRLVDEQELQASREGASVATERPSSLGGVASFQPLDPSVLQFNPVDLAGVQREAETLTFRALEGVQNRIPEISEFASGFNRASEEAFEDVLDFVLPGNQEQIRTDISNLASNLIQGKLPSDVSRRIFLQAAARSQRTGQAVTSPFIRQITTSDLAQGFLGGVEAGTNLVAFSRNIFTPPFIDPGRLGLQTFGSLAVPVGTALQNAQFNTQGEYNALVNRFNAEANNRLALQAEEQARLDRERGLRQAREASRFNTLQLVGMAAGALIGGVGAGAVAGGLTATQGAALGATLGSTAGATLGATQLSNPTQQGAAIGAASTGVVQAINLLGGFQAQNQQNQLVNAILGASVQPSNSFNTVPGTPGDLTRLIPQPTGTGSNQTALGSL